MKRNRIDRKNDFDEFFDSSEDIFKDLRDNDSRADKFEREYMLCVCPGSRNGGTEKRIIEVFWGSRNYEFQTLGRSWKALTETGATLSIYRNDTGHLTISIYPAKTKFRKPFETSITIYKWIDSIKLKDSRFVKSIWNDFIAYMECTSLDGAPTLLQRIRISYLRNFKNLVINETWQQTKFSIFSRDVLKFVFTVGLSGFVFFMVTMLNEPSEKKTDLLLNDINGNIEKVSSHLNEIKENDEIATEMTKGLDSLNIRLTDIIKHSDNIDNQTKQIEKVNLKLREISNQIKEISKNNDWK